MDTLKIKVSVTESNQADSHETKTQTVLVSKTPCNQPVRVGELMKGMVNISSHPQREEILKSIFSNIDFDPYA